MNKWQQKYSELLSAQKWISYRYQSEILALIISVLIMLVEDKLHE